MLVSYLIVFLKTSFLNFIILLNFDFLKFIFCLIFILLIVLLDTSNDLNNYKVHYSFFKNNNFFKESFYIDWFQKKGLDKFFLHSLIISTQFYNLNIWIFSVTKYLYKFLITTNLWLYSNFTNNVGLILITLGYYFLIISNIALLIVFLI